jgi:hypothetical protein
MKSVHMPSTSNTVVVSQLYELERSLLRSVRAKHVILAIELGMTGAEVLSGHDPETLPEDAVLERLWWDGPSEYPFVYGSFRHQSSPDPLLTQLHTASLQALSHWLKLRQCWGF